jgi:DNA-binding response OmpR family regulator
LSQGFADCITKPIDQKNLNLRLCQFFKNHKLEDSHLMAMKERIKARIEDMAGNNQSKAAKLMQYLAEEVKLAIKEWKLALITMDWSSARKILHREKMMIQAVGITGLDTIIEDFENENAGKTDHEMHMMLSRLIELFTEIDSMFSS